MSTSKKGGKVSNEHRQQYLKDKFEMSEEERDGMSEDYFIDQILDSYKLDHTIALINNIRGEAKSYGINIDMHLLNKLGFKNAK